MTTTPEGRAEPLSPEERDDLMVFALRATQGPWKADGTIYEHMVSEIRSIMPGEERGIAQVWQHPQGFADARFIAAANPATVLSLLAALEEAEGRMTEALTMTGSKDLADLIDMANIGRSMMERMAQVTESGPMRGWSPADDPAEIVTDLANRLDDALHDYGNAESEAKGLEADVADLTARAEASEQREAGLREALGRIKEISDPGIRIERPRLNLDRAWEIADAAVTTKSGEASQ